MFKLISGEVINDVVRYEPHIENGQIINKSHETYLGVGYKDEDVTNPHNIWVNTREYSILDLKTGDKVLTEINGERKWVIIIEQIGDTGASLTISVDGTYLANPITSYDIIYVEEGNTCLTLLKSFLAKKAILEGGDSIKNYIHLFGDLPFKEGTPIKVKEGYHVENNKLNIRNNHRILNENDLVLDHHFKSKDYITVKSTKTGKKTDISVISVEIKR
jgi:hypothetical protein